MQMYKFLIGSYSLEIYLLQYKVLCKCGMYQALKIFFGGNQPIIYDVIMVLVSNLYVRYILGYFQHMLPYNFACIYLGIQGDPHRGLTQINDFRKYSCGSPYTLMKIEEYYVVIGFVISHWNITIFRGKSNESSI